MSNARDAHRARIEATLRALGANPQIVDKRQLPIHLDARQLSPLGLGTDGRDKFATPAAARAWTLLRSAAATDGVTLLLHSAFRSFDYQLSLIRYKIAKGRPLDEVLAVNAPPGCSEHHSGRALDIGCPDTPPLEEAFENTSAFAWLCEQAPGFGFRMSFPRGNHFGFLYEPWHWYFAGTRAAPPDHPRPGPD